MKAKKKSSNKAHSKKNGQRKSTLNKCSMKDKRYVTRDMKFYNIRNTIQHEKIKADSSNVKRSPIKSCNPRVVLENLSSETLAKYMINIQTQKLLNKEIQSNNDVSHIFDQKNEIKKTSLNLTNNISVNDKSNNKRKQSSPVVSYKIGILEPRRILRSTLSSGNIIVDNKYEQNHHTYDDQESVSSFLKNESNDQSVSAKKMKKDEKCTVEGKIVKKVQSSVISNKINRIKARRPLRCALYSGNIIDGNKFKQIHHIRNDIESVSSFSKTNDQSSSIKEEMRNEKWKCKKRRTLPIKSIDVSSVLRNERKEKRTAESYIKDIEQTTILNHLESTNNKITSNLDLHAQHINITKIVLTKLENMHDNIYVNNWKKKCAQQALLSPNLESIIQLEDFSINKLPTETIDSAHEDVIEVSNTYIRKGNELNLNTLQSKYEVPKNSKVLLMKLEKLKTSHKEQNLVSGIKPSTAQDTDRFKFYFNDSSDVFAYNKEVNRTINEHIDGDLVESKKNNVMIQHLSSNSNSSTIQLEENSSSSSQMILQDVHNSDNFLEISSTEDLDNPEMYKPSSVIISDKILKKTTKLKEIKILPLFIREQNISSEKNNAALKLTSNVYHKDIQILQNNKTTLTNNSEWNVLEENIDKVLSYKDDTPQLIIDKNFDDKSNYLINTDNLHVSTEPLILNNAENSIDTDVLTESTVNELTKKIKKDKTNVLCCDNNSSCQCYVPKELFHSMTSLPNHINRHIKEEFQEEIKLATRKQNSRNINANNSVGDGEIIDMVTTDLNETTQESIKESLNILPVNITTIESLRTGLENKKDERLQKNISEKVKNVLVPLITKNNKNESIKYSTIHEKIYKFCACHKEKFETEIFIGLVLFCNVCNVLYQTIECFNAHLENKEKYICNGKQLTSKISQIYCRICETILHNLTDYIHIATHMENHLIFMKSIKLFCHICEIRFIGMGPIFHRHWSQHEKNVCYKALISDFPKISVVNSNSLEWSIITSDEFKYIVVTEHICNNCHAQCFSKNQLKLHVSSCTPKPPVLELHSKRLANDHRDPNVHSKLNIPLDTVTFPTKSSSKKHTPNLQNNSELINKKKMHVCKVCLDAFDSIKELIIHWNDHHEIDENFTCDQCTQSFTNRNRYVEHLKNCISVVNPVNDSFGQIHKRDFTCKVCNLTFDSTEIWHQHIATHENNFSNSNTVYPNNAPNISSAKEISVEYKAELEPNLIEHKSISNHSIQQNTLNNRIAPVSESISEVSKNQHSITNQLIASLKSPTNFSSIELEEIVSDDVSLSNQSITNQDLKSLSSISDMQTGDLNAAQIHNFTTNSKRSVLKKKPKKDKNVCKVNNDSNKNNTKDLNDKNTTIVKLFNSTQKTVFDKNLPPSKTINIKENNDDIILNEPENSGKNQNNSWKAMESTTSFQLNNSIKTNEKSLKTAKYLRVRNISELMDKKLRYNMYNVQDDTNIPVSSCIATDLSNRGQTKKVNVEPHLIVNNLNVEKQVISVSSSEQSNSKQCNFVPSESELKLTLTSIPTSVLRTKSTPDTTPFTSVIKSTSALPNALTSASALPNASTSASALPNASISSLVQKTRPITVQKSVGRVKPLLPYIQLPQTPLPTPSQSAQMALPTYTPQSAQITIPTYTPPQSAQIPISTYTPPPLAQISMPTHKPQSTRRVLAIHIRPPNIASGTTQSQVSNIQYSRSKPNWHSMNYIHNPNNCFMTQPQNVANNNHNIIGSSSLPSNFATHNHKNNTFINQNNNNLLSNIASTSITTNLQSRNYLSSKNFRTGQPYNSNPMVQKVLNNLLNEIAKQKSLNINAQNRKELHMNNKTSSPSVSSSQHYNCNISNDRYIPIKERNLTKVEITSSTQNNNSAKNMNVMQEQSNNITETPALYESGLMTSQSATIPQLHTLSHQPSTSLDNFEPSYCLYLCNFCPNSSMAFTKEEYSSHLYSQHNFICNVCLFRCYTANSLASHKLRYHNL